MKRLTIAITALCATAMLAVYCTEVKFENPADPKRGGWNGYACLQDDNTCQEFKSLSEWDACYPSSKRIHKSQCPPMPSEDSVYCLTESGCGKLPSSAACLEAGGTVVEKCSTAVVTPDTTRYTVTFNTNGGVPATIDSVVVDSGKTMGTAFPQTIPAKADSVFGGWFDSVSIQYFDTTTIHKDITLTAAWIDTAGGVVTPPDTTRFTVTFNTGGGNPATIDSVVVDSGGVLGARFPEDPAKAGNTFGGWFDGVKQYYENTEITKSVLLVAVWNETASTCIRGETCGDDSVFCVIGTNCWDIIRSVCNAASGTIVVVCPIVTDPAKQDNEDIAAAKKAVEDAVYGPVSQEVLNDEEAAKKKVESVIDGLDLKEVEAVVDRVEFKAAVAGASGSAGGTNGSYTFTVKLNKGIGVEAVTEARTLVITATPYDVTQDDKDITAAKTMIELTAYGPVDQAACNTIAAAKAYVDSVISTLNLNDVEAVVNNVSFDEADSATISDPNGGKDGIYKFTVNLTKGAGDPKTTMELTLKINATKLPTYAVNVVSSVTGGAPTGSNNYAAGATVDINAGTIPNGYNFANWTANQTVTFTPNENSTLASFTMPASVVTVTANWTPIQCTISYILNNGTVATANLENYNVETATFTLNNPTQNGYTFTGWTGSNGTTPQTSVSVTLGSTGNRSYTANWTPTQYTITYILNSGTVATANRESYTIETQTFTLNNPTKANHTFMGWTGSNGTTSEMTVVIELGSFGDKTYTANFQEFCASGFDESEYFCDGRDGKEYRYVKIGSGINMRTWMAENLNYDTLGSRCYDDDPANCETYGRLYDWNTVMAGSTGSSASGGIFQGICPSGWHVSNNLDWNTLANNTTAGTKLKSQDGWNSFAEIPAGTDEYGFSALPGGHHNSSNGFVRVGYYGYWWSAMESTDNKGEYWSMHYNTDKLETNNIDKSTLLSLRCVKN